MRFRYDQVPYQRWLCAGVSVYLYAAGFGHALGGHEGDPLAVSEEVRHRQKAGAGRGMSRDLMDIFAILIFGILWIEILELRTLPERYRDKR